jgi:hypothetical protein
VHPADQLSEQLGALRRRAIEATREIADDGVVAKRSESPSPQRQPHLPAGLLNKGPHEP